MALFQQQCMSPDIETVASYSNELLLIFQSIAFLYNSQASAARTAQNFLEIRLDLSGPSSIALASQSWSC